MAATARRKSDMYATLTQALRYAGADAEGLHNAAMKALAIASRSDRLLNRMHRQYWHRDPRLAVTNPAGNDYPLRLPNPIGIAAGLDKQAVAMPALAALGYGVIEVGTVTPLPQPGNARPRVFSLPADEAIANAMGFPSEGMRQIQYRLGRVRLRGYALGGNVGPNKAAMAEGVDAAMADFVVAAACLLPHVDYLTVNPSSPNTPGLRQMVIHAARMVSELTGLRDEVAPGKLLVFKLAPPVDTGFEALDVFLEQAASHTGVAVQLTNTWRQRPPLRRRRAGWDMGGFSGSQTALATLQTVKYVRYHAGGKLPIMATGLWDGPFTEALLRAGAFAVLGYTGPVYGGPDHAGGICRHLSAALDREGMGSIHDLIGTDAQ